MSLDLNDTALGDLEDASGSPVYSHVISMTHCLEASDGDSYASPNDDTFFALGIELTFDKYEDYEEFRTHPQLLEIENRIIGHMSDAGNSTFALELDRDNNEFYTDDNGPETFTSGTLGDFDVVLDEIIPTINEQYSAKISQYSVGKESIQAPSCIPSYLGPNKHASLYNAEQPLDILSR